MEKSFLGAKSPELGCSPHPWQDARACSDPVESEHALESLIWSHFLRRTGAHSRLRQGFGGSGVGPPKQRSRVGGSAENALGRLSARSVDQRIGPQTRTLQMHRQDAPVELARSLRAADHAGLLDETEDRHIADPGAGKRRHPVQRIAPLEDLQIAWLQAQGADEALIAVQHRLHAGIVFVGRRSQTRAVLEIAAGLRVLDRQGHGVVVGVEMPGKAAARLGQVDDHVGQRVGIGKEPRLAQRRLYERTEGGPFVDRAQDAFGAEIVRRNEGVRPVVEPAQGMACRQVRPIPGEIGIRPAEIAMAVDRDPVAFLDQRIYTLGTNEALQDGAAIRVESLAQASDEGVARGAGLVDGIAPGIDVVGGIWHLLIAPRWEGTTVRRAVAGGRAWPRCSLPARAAKIIPEDPHPALGLLHPLPCATKAGLSSPSLYPEPGSISNP